MNWHNLCLDFKLQILFYTPSSIKGYISKMEYFIWNADPNIFEFGTLQVGWYGILFSGSFILSLLLIQWIYRREYRDPDISYVLLLYALAGVIIGARLMHCFAYEPNLYLSHPLEIFKVWNGGLASHGGMLGALLALWIFARRNHESYLWLISRMTIPGTLIAAFVRFGNFFNSEIVGKTSDYPWAIIFERYDMLPRHPVQLYEAFSYLILFILLLWLYKKVSFSFATDILFGVFLTFMFIMRFLLEYTKTRQADYAFDIPFTVGQLLSMPLILLGIIWIIYVLIRRKEYKTKNA